AKFSTVAPYRINKIAFWQQPGVQYSDIIAVEKGNGSTKARILYYNGLDSTLKVIGTLPNGNYGGGGVEEQGLTGVALNPKTFEQDNFLYLYYATGALSTTPSATIGFRVTRVKIDWATKMIDWNSEKVLIHIPAATSARWHTAGAMQFDNFGNLYIAVADNESLAMGPGNTANLRGGILRIHPDTTDPRGYTIPAGNFGDYWAQKWQDSGLTDRAAKYRDTSKVKPEIYVKGSRNPYSMSLDKNRLGWLSYGQCGPDAQRGETQNLVTHPTFGGWPFWVWNNAAGTPYVRQSAKASSYDESPEVGSGTAWTTFNPTTMTINIPVNNYSGNTGVDTLPPYVQPLYGYNGPTCAQGGPVIRYDGRVSNPRKMPPHLDFTYMYTDVSAYDPLGTNVVRAVKFDTATGAAIGTPVQVFTMSKSTRPNLAKGIDFQQGPDGSLYYVDWGITSNTDCCSASPPAASGGVVRVTYNGDCQDAGLYPVTGINAKAVFHGQVSWLRVGVGEISLRDDGSGLIDKGSHVIQILDVNGRTVHSFKGQGSKTYAMPALEHGKVFVLRAETAIGTAVRTFSSL
ncbi:MAG TPA: PQQ-dependent sugar dehydrogenase, partial [Fibrobacteria bacterium]|nr:PQQ-dependent sugar dehydrogenase [Fibrobacteria bacterium]